MYYVYTSYRYWVNNLALCFLDMLTLLIACSLQRLARPISDTDLDSVQQISLLELHVKQTLYTSL